MSSNRIPECFQSLFETRKKITISEDKILVPYESTVLEIIFYIGFFLPLIGFSYYATVYSLGKSTFQAIWLVYFLFFIFTFSVFFKSNKVIDFNNNTFYSRITIFGIDYNFNHFSLNDILFVCNNVTTQMFNPGGKSGYYEGKRVEVNDKTKQFQHYYVSFLLKDGRLINFIHLGIFFEDYKDSLKIAETISDHWCIPLVTCQDDCTFEVKRNYGGDYYLSAKGIEKGSVLKRLGVIFLIILLVIVVTWIISLFNNKQKNRYNYGYPTYHHRRY